MEYRRSPPSTLATARQMAGQVWDDLAGRRAKHLEEADALSEQLMKLQPLMRNLFSSPPNKAA